MKERLEWKVIKAQWQLLWKGFLEGCVFPMTCYLAVFCAIIVVYNCFL